MITPDQVFRPNIHNDLDKFIAKVGFPVNVEPKLNGEYWILEERGGHMQAANRGKTVYTEQYLKQRGHGDLVIAVQTLVDEGLYVCEATCNEGRNINGKLASGLFQSAIADASNGRVELWFHDVLDCKYQSALASELYSERRVLLERCIDFVPNSPHIQLVPTSVCRTMQEVTAQFEGMVKLGYEGVMIKSQKGREWCKLKDSVTEDVVILAIKKTKDWNEHGLARSVLLGRKEEEGWLIVGVAGTGLNHEEQKAIAVSAQVLTAKSGDYRVLNMNLVDPSEFVWIRPRWCVEVSYLQKTENGSMLSPSIVRIRTDKVAE